MTSFTPEDQTLLCVRINEMASKHADKPIALKIIYHDQRAVQASFPIRAGGLQVPATLIATTIEEGYAIICAYLESHRHKGI